MFNAGTTAVSAEHSPLDRDAMSIPTTRLASVYVVVPHYREQLSPMHGETLTHGALPFGCHGWNRLYPKFWKEQFERRGLSMKARGKDQR